MTDFQDHYRVHAKCIDETEKAIKVIIDTIGQAWIPKSQIDDRSEVYKNGDEGELWVSEWIAEQKGWT